MEHFRRWGLADTLRTRAPLPVTWSDEAVFATSLLGREITRFHHCFGLELTGSDLVAEPGQQVPQPVVEQLLRDTVLARGVATLITGAEVVAVGQSAAGAWADVVFAGNARQRIDAEYVIGCEGARSLVSQAIGARYVGGDDVRPNLSIVFRSPGLAARVPHGPAVHYWVINPEQPGLVGRLDLDETWWCVAQDVSVVDEEHHAERIVRNLVGADIAVEVLSTDAWRARMLLADRYADRRLLIAGDAAHQNPPWGGHGFNTGIGDAVNLGWKLAAVIRGWGGPRLLDSYEQERRPVAQRTIDEAVRNMSTLSLELANPALNGTDEDFARTRPAVADAIQQSKDSEFHSLELTLGYQYRDSPIVISDGHREQVMTAGEPGTRLAHRWLGKGDSLYDHLGRGFTLLGDIDSPAARRLATAAADHDVSLTMLRLADNDRARLLGAELSLVRPDQHVAWRGTDPIDANAVIQTVTGAGAEDPHKLS